MGNFKLHLLFTLVLLITILLSLLTSGCVHITCRFIKKKEYYSASGAGLMAITSMYALYSFVPLLWNFKCN